MDSLDFEELQYCDWFTFSRGKSETTAMFVSRVLNFHIYIYIYIFIYLFWQLNFQRSNLIIQNGKKNESREK